MKYEKFFASHERDYGEEFSAEFKDLMINMLAYEPYQRLNLVEVLMHPFFASGVATDNEKIEVMQSIRSS